MDANGLRNAAQAAAERRDSTHVTVFTAEWNYWGRWVDDVETCGWKLDSFNVTALISGYTGGAPIQHRDARHLLFRRT